MSRLDDLAKEVADDQAAVDGVTENTRKRVIRMGKSLRKMQVEQKKEQDETGQTWKDWCDDRKSRPATFPSATQSKYYVLIGRYPGAYKTGMSIKEAYKEAGKWKKNGGNEPLKEKLTIKARPLITIGAAAGKLERKIEKLVESDMLETATAQEWTDDEIDGATDAVTLLRQSCNLLLRNLRGLREEA